MKYHFSLILLFSFFISNMFSQTDVGISMLKLRKKYPSITFYRVKDLEDPSMPMIKYFSADFKYQEYYYMTNSLEMINSCMFKINKFRLPSFIMLYNQKYKVIKKNEIWEYSLDAKNYVTVSIEQINEQQGSDYFITFASYPEMLRKKK